MAGVDAMGIEPLAVPKRRWTRLSTVGLATVMGIAVAEVLLFRYIAGCVASFLAGQPTGPGAEVLYYRAVVVMPGACALMVFAAVGLWLLRGRGRATAVFTVSVIVAAVALVIYASAILYGISNVGG
jgi:hypothetical protein